MINGVDISKYDKKLTIADIKAAGYKFAILRGGYTGYSSLKKNVDPLFETFYAQAKAANFPVGCYYYSCATSKQGGIDEANFLYENCLKGKQFEYPIYIDIEDSHNQKGKKTGTTDAIIGFCDTLKAKGYYVGVYSNPSWFTKYIESDRLVGISKWLAHWVTKPDFCVENIEMWQNTDNTGIKGEDVDTDISFVDFPSLIKYYGLNGFNAKTIDELAKEVIAGKWGKGSERKKLLTEAGYDYAAVQKRVNELLK